MPGALSVSATIDQASVLGMAEVGSLELTQAMEFAAGQIAGGIRFKIFDAVVEGLGRRAGRAFPGVYTEHLIAFMHLPDLVPILVEILGPGIIGIQYDLENLGNYEDYSLGFHHNALIDTGFSAEEKRKKKNFEIHPSHVPFPPGWTGEDLLNTRERRLEWWTQAIIGRNPNSVINPRTPQSVQALQRAAVPTFAEVARARVTQAWLPARKAPQWLILENGTAEAPPFSQPQDFIFVLREASLCYADEIMRAAITTLHETAVAAGQSVRSVAVGRGGRTQLTTTVPHVGNRFVSFKERLSTNLGNVGICLDF